MPPANSRSVAGSIIQLEQVEQVIPLSLEILQTGFKDLAVCVCSLLFSNPLPSRTAAVFNLPYPVPNSLGVKPGRPCSPVNRPAKNEGKRRYKQRKEQRKGAGIEEFVQITES